MGVIYVMRAATATAMTPVTAMDFWVGAVATVATTAATPAATPVVTVDVTPAATAVPVPLAILACTAPPASAIGRPLPQSGRQDAPRAPISRRTQPIRASQRQAHVHMCAARIFTARAAAACPARPVPGHLATRFLTVRLTARATTASVQSPPFALWSPLPATAATAAPFCAFCPFRRGILTRQGGDSRFIQHTRHT